MLAALVLAHIGSVNADDVADALADGKVLELFREEHERGVLDHSFRVDGLGRVRDFQLDDKAVGLIGLVRERGIENHSVEVETVSIAIHITVLDRRVCVLATLIFLLLLLFLSGRTSLGFTH